MLTRKGIAVAWSLLESHGYPLPFGDDAAGERGAKAWQVTLEDLTDEELVGATRAWLRSPTPKYGRIPDPGDLLAHRPTPELPALEGPVAELTPFDRLWELGAWQLDESLVEDHPTYGQVERCADMLAQQILWDCLAKTKCDHPGKVCDACWPRFARELNRRAAKAMKALGVPVDG